MQTSKWTSLDLTSDSGAKKFAPLAGGSYKNAFLRIRKVDDFVDDGVGVEELFVMTQILVNDVNPVVVVMINRSEFVTKAACNNLANWAVIPGTTGLALTSVVWLTPRSATLSFTGTAAAGDISIQVLPVAMLSEATNVVRIYTIAAAADVFAFTQTEIAGTVNVYQYLRNDDIVGFVNTLTPPAKASVFVKDMILTSENAFDASLESNFVYIPGGAEAATYKIYAKLCIE